MCHDMARNAATACGEMMSDEYGFIYIPLIFAAFSTRYQNEVYISSSTLSILLAFHRRETSYRIVHAFHLLL